MNQDLRQVPGGAQGWREFLAEKRRLMRAFADAHDHAVSRPTKTDVGPVAEAVFRSWLEQLLPTRYGVTSGAIISAGRSDQEAIKYFDVIIYNKLDSPVFWRSADPDLSSQGTKRAIPVEHVLAVMEVKSTLSRKSAEEAAEKLSELAPLLAKIDPPETLSPSYLPARFVCCTIFFSVTSSSDEWRSEKLLLPLASLTSTLRGYRGGMVLSPRYDSLSDDRAGYLRPIPSETPVLPTLGKQKQDIFGNAPQCRSVMVDGFHYSIELDWADNNFQRFTYDLIAMLKGTYHPQYLSSTHLMKATPYLGEGQDPRFPLDGAES